MFKKLYVKIAKIIDVSNARTEPSEAEKCTLSWQEGAWQSFVPFPLQEQTVCTPLYLCTLYRIVFMLNINTLTTECPIWGHNHKSYENRSTYLPSTFAGRRSHFYAENNKDTRNRTDKSASNLSRLLNSVRDVVVLQFPDKSCQ